MDSVSSNKRIAKNTLLLYIRTMVTLTISLYTSRLVLKALGVEDLGIYNVVGGIVAMLSFFLSSQSVATSRFITFELGANRGVEQLRKVFSVCLSIHLLIAIVVLVLGETVGILVLKYWTEIPVERQGAAFVVYQCSLLVFCVHIMLVPYTAVVIAHEKMNILAYFSIVEALLRLGVVVFIYYTHGDHLILYGALLAVVSIIMLLLYIYSVYSRFSFYKGKLVWDKIQAKNMLTFTGWSFVGSSSNAATQQGVNLLFNNFVGLVANAAMGFTNQVRSAVGHFVSSFTTAFNPQIIKLYAQQDIPKLHLLMYRASKFSFVLAFLFSLPLIVNMDFVLNLWLGDVPDYTVAFCQLTLVCTTIDATTGVYNTTVSASGKIRNYEIAISCSFLFDLLCAYLLLLVEFHPALVFGSRILTRGLINMVIGLYFIRRRVDFHVLDYCRKVLLPISITIVVTIAVVLAADGIFAGWGNLLLTSSVAVASIALCAWHFIFNKNERGVVLSTIRQRLHR